MYGQEGLCHRSSPSRRRRNVVVSPTLQGGESDHCRAESRRDVARSGFKRMAEREGFEPPIPVKVWPLSRRLVSTAHAPLRAARTSRLPNQCNTVGKGQSVHRQLRTASLRLSLKTDGKSAAPDRNWSITCRAIVQDRRRKRTHCATGVRGKTLVALPRNARRARRT